MQELKATPLADGLMMPEGPRWHAGKLWVSDIFGERVVSCDPDGTIETVATVPHRPSGIGFRGDQILITSMLDGLVVGVADDGRLETVHDVSSFGDGTHYWDCIINDMVVDGRGNAYIGVYGVGEDHRETGIILVRPDGSVVEVADGIAGVNGLVVTPDYSTLIVAELDSDHLSAFDIAADGTLSNRRVWARVPGSTPDGICLDAEGAIWFGSVYTHEFFRVAEGGKVLAHIQSERCGIAPALGGPDGTTLYLCTADTDKSRLAQSDAVGFIDVVEVDVPGAGWP